MRPSFHLCCLETGPLAEELGHCDGSHNRQSNPDDKTVVPSIKLMHGHYPITDYIQREIKTNLHLFWPDEKNIIRKCLGQTVAHLGGKFHKKKKKIKAKGFYHFRRI